MHKAGFKHVSAYIERSVTHLEGSIPIKSVATSAERALDMVNHDTHGGFGCCPSLLLSKDRGLSYCPGASASFCWTLLAMLWYTCPVLLSGWLATIGVPASEVSLIPISRGTCHGHNSAEHSHQANMQRDLSNCTWNNQAYKFIINVCDDEIQRPHLLESTSITTCKYPSCQQMPPAKC